MPQLTIDQAFALALQHHRENSFEQAGTLYRQILQISPNHPGALLNLGVISETTGQREIAIDLFRRAVSVKADSVDALAQLGICLGESGQVVEAIKFLNDAIALRPHDPKLHNFLGLNLARIGDFAAAVTCFDCALRRDPKFLAALNNLGNALKDSGQNDRAVERFQRLLALDPGYLLAHFNLGNCFKAAGDLHKAIDCYKRAVELDSTFVQALDGLGSCWKQSGELEKAIDCFRKVIALRPASAEAHGNVGVLLADFGLPEQAIEHYRRAVALDPGNANARYNLGMELLLVGQFDEGWQLCESRWERADLVKYKPNLAQPMWDGHDLCGRTILLHAEQGMGDVLQFVRYVPIVIRHGGRVVLDCQPELARLIATSLPTCQVVRRGQPLPRIDVHCPLMSLPFVLGTTMQNIPGSVPYLAPVAQDSTKWRDRLASLGPATNVGICWAGTRVNPNRSITASLLRILRQPTQIRFVSLQMDKSDPAYLLDNETLDMVDWTSELKDFADTAALIANLDLVITIDTANAHLAGGLGVPTWVLLPFAADWRWLVHRSDSPWYPTMRLFRQAAPGDWSTALSELIGALRT